MGDARRSAWRRSKEKGSAQWGISFVNEWIVCTLVPAYTALNKSFFCFVKQRHRRGFFLLVLSRRTVSLTLLNSNRREWECNSLATLYRTFFYFQRWRPIYRPDRGEVQLASDNRKASMLARHPVIMDTDLKSAAIPTNTFQEKFTQVPRKKNAR
jgi:hypothetical protein